MKEGIFKRNKFTRVIALLLAMIMMSAPFFAHAGLKGDSKAEEGKKNHIMTGISLTTDIAVSNARIAKNTSTGNYTIGYLFNGVTIVDMLPIKDIKYYFAPEYLSLTIDSSSVTNNINFSGIEDDNNLVSGKKLTASFDGKIYYSIGFDKTNIKELTGENKITINDTTTEVYFWLKPVVMDDDNTVYPTDYEPVAKVSFADRGLKSLNVPTITDNNNNSTNENSYYKSVRIQNTTVVSSGDQYIGNVYFGYIDSEGQFTKLENSTPKEINTTGTYTPCIRYGFSEADVIKDTTGTPVKIDRDAPACTARFVRKDASGKEVRSTEVSASSGGMAQQAVYMNTGQDSFYLIIEAGDNGSGIDVEKSKKMTDTNGNVITADTKTEGSKTTFTWKIEAASTYNCRISDKAGNETTYPLVVNSDNGAPTISAMEAKVSKSGTDTDIAYSGSTDTNKDKYYNLGSSNLSLNVSMTDTGVVDKILLYYKLNTASKYNELTAKSINANGTSFKASFDETSFTELANLKSGTYDFYFIAEDAAGNQVRSGEKHFNVDRTPPTYNSATYYYTEDNGKTWKTWSQNEKGKYVFNTDLMDAGKIQYSVLITATDDFSGMKQADVKTGNGNKEDSIGDGSEVRYIFNSSDLSNLDNKDTIVEISFKDKAENETGNDNNHPNYILKKEQIDIADAEIKILSGTLKIYETGNKENELELGVLTDDNINITEYINKSYTISIEAVSGYEIDKATLEATLFGGTSSLSIGGSCQGNTFDVTEGKKKSVVTFEIPGEDLLRKSNERLQAIKLTVGDTNSQLAEKTIGEIFYDISRPRLAGTNAETKWYQNLNTLEYTIVSESYQVEGQSLPDVDSGLSWQNYEITNSRKDTISEYVKDGLGGAPSVGGRIYDVPESLTSSGTVITFHAEDRAGNSIYDEDKANIVAVKVDKHAPTVTNLAVNGNTNHQVPYGGQPVISATANDNLTLDQVVVEVVYPDGVTRGATNTINKEASGQDGIKESTNYTVEAVNGEVLDGEYEVMMYALDMSGRQSMTQRTTFRIDNSKPVVTARVIGGTASPKTVAPYYYKDNVTVELTYQDNNMPASSVVVEDNGSTVQNINWTLADETTGKYRAVITLAAEGSHTITINATDESGNNAEEKSITFVVDKTSPTITAYVNGTTVYNDSMGSLMLTGTTTVSMNVSDMTYDAEDNYVQIQKNVPNAPASNPAYIKTSNTNMTFSDEADYVVNFYAVDRANNESATKTVRFRVDRTAPELSISGGGTSANATNVTFTMREAFWWDANASLTIYRKAGDGAREELYKTISFNPSAYQTSVSEALSDTGVYRFEFEARDNVGHRSSISQTLTLDLEAPVVTLRGVNDYDMTGKAVEFAVEITDDFYSSKKVSIQGTRTDIDGKVHKLDFGSFLQSMNPTTITQTFTESGVYDITLVATDLVGNEHKEEVHFTIDNAAPVIGDLSKYDGKIFKSFSWDEDLDELVSDLTVCDVQMFLNGSEYDGSSDIEDGSYVLLIVATDEMGNKTEKEVRFELDSKAPVFIVTGVEDKEVKNEDYIINVSLQLDEDTLSQVTLNGTNISIRDNTATINVTEKGEYTLVLRAYDAAGNEAEETITFTYGEEKSLWWIWIVVACGIILLGTVIIIIVKKKKEN
ncbi:MAG: Ig-like domain-containing protein [Clostridium sp.]|nr:Ig-like domain-containing protein [Clostridium sp.]MCM1171969.1 Ig-like domain-containing protein [Clostridium sp.]MCM1209031.1 Ig-like domain-containing protein [Ruminococcus sp.]